MLIAIVLNDSKDGSKQLQQKSRPSCQLCALQGVPMLPLPSVPLGREPSLLLSVPGFLQLIRRNPDTTSHSRQCKELAHKGQNHLTVWK